MSTDIVSAVTRWKDDADSVSAPGTMHSFGSRDWAEHVFTTPPARIVKGRTRWTHRHLCWSGVLQRGAYVESRNELIGLLALEYLHNLGMVRRFKEQPFTTPSELFQAQYTPDFLFESSSGRLYLSEVKSKRFLTRDIERKLSNFKSEFIRYGLQFLLWTDKTPLNKTIAHNLIRLKMSTYEYFSTERIAELVDTLTLQPLTVQELLYKSFDIDLVCSAAWDGKVFIPLHKPISTLTTVTLSPVEDFESYLINCDPDPDAWWHDLDDAI